MTRQIIKHTFMDSMEEILSPSLRCLRLSASSLFHRGMSSSTDDCLSGAVGGLLFLRACISSFHCGTEVSVWLVQESSETDEDVEVTDTRFEWLPFMWTAGLSWLEKLSDISDQHWTCLISSNLLSKKCDSRYSLSIRKHHFGRKLMLSLWKTVVPCGFNVYFHLRWSMVLR